MLRKQEEIFKNQHLYKYHIVYKIFNLFSCIKIPQTKLLYWKVVILKPQLFCIIWYPKKKIATNNVGAENQITVKTTIILSHGDVNSKCICVTVVFLLELWAKRFIFMLRNAIKCLTVQCCLKVKDLQHGNHTVLHAAYMSLYCIMSSYRRLTLCHHCSYRNLWIKLWIKVIEMQSINICKRIHSNILIIHSNFQ